jgi:uncharacterized membrane protein YkvA (DUF1232 family)
MQSRAGAVAAYALSPIDLIADFIPILGYADDLVIVRLGIMAAVRLIPSDMLAELRTKAAGQTSGADSRAGLAVILLIWMIAAMAVLYSVMRLSEVSPI